MFVILDWQTHALVVEDNSVKTFDTYKEATKYAEEELQTGLWTVIPVTEDALFFLD